MTINVPVSITVKIDGNIKKEIFVNIVPEELGNSLSDMVHQIFNETGEAVISHLDNKIFQNKPENWKNTGTEKRSITTVGGIITYKRRIYKKPDGKRIKPVDEMLHFTRYSRRDHDMKMLHCALAGHSNYREAAQESTLLTHNQVSASTISRDVRAVGLALAEKDENFYTEEKGKIFAPVLYGESDGIHVRLQKDQSKSLEIRAGIIYTGKKWISKNRNRLLNKTTIIDTDISTEQWQTMIRNHLFAHYDFDSVQLMAVGGDGGSWVKSSFDLCGIKHQEFVLDPFHVIRAVNQAFRNAVNTHDVLDSLFRNGFEAVKPILKPLLNKGDAPTRRKRRACFSYLDNHKDFLLPLYERGLPFDNLSSLGCMESAVGKKIALRMKTRGCSWSRKGAKAMALVLCHLQELEQQSFRTLDFVFLKRKNIRYSAKSKKFVAPQIHHASFPIVNIGKMSSPYFREFKNIMDCNSLSSFTEI